MRSLEPPQLLWGWCVRTWAKAGAGDRRTAIKTRGLTREDAAVAVGKEKHISETVAAGSDD